MSSNQHNAPVPWTAWLEINGVCEGLKSRNSNSFPASLLVHVVPRVDVLAASDPIADKFRVAIVAKLKGSYDPSRSRVHISLQLHHLFRQSLRQSIQEIVGALVTSFAAWIGFNRVEWSFGPVHGIVIITEDCA